MERVIVMMMLGGAFLGQALAAPGPKGQAAITASAVKADNSGGHFTDVPPLPKGKSTILGGSIQNVDPVRDQFTLHIYGEKPMRILFDERTQVFRDGKKISLQSLGPATHASVQTTLDGADVFAISVHIMSQQAAGNYQGRVVSYNPDTGLLMLASSASHEQFGVRVTSQTSFKRQGQSAFSSVPSSANDLVPGSLVTVEFEADNRGRGLAQQITVLAAPGATFVFSGTLASLDMPGGVLTLVDPRDNQSYRIFFDSTRDPASRLRAGQHLRISADYDGSRYVATEIAVE
jgi:hypothetical protein